MKKNVIVLMAFLILVSSFVFAADFKINFDGNKIFTEATNATVLAQNISLTGWLSSAGNITTTAFFVGSGQFLTDIPTYNATYDAMFDFTDFQTSFDLNASGLLIDYGNFSFTDFKDSFNTNISAWENLVNATYLSTYNATYASHAVDGVTIKYQNITNLPTCDVGEHLDFDGTDLTCTADTGSDFTNVAYYNESNTWAEEQEFSENINISKNIVLMSDTASITREGSETINITIDSGGINFNLG